MSYSEAAMRERHDEVGDNHPDAAGNANKLLIALDAAEWRTTQDLVREVGHRFSTSVQYLRDRGHAIEKRQGDGRGYEYRYAGLDEKVKADDDWQQRYYASTHWRSLRKARLEIDNFECCWCGRKYDLHVHHWRYDLFQEQLRDLMTLCSTCHDRVHSYDAVKISFPRYVRKTVFEQLACAPEPQPRQVLSGEVDDPPPSGMLFATSEPDSYYDA